MSPEKKSFEEVLKAQEPKPEECPICQHPDRAKIEEAKKNGVPQKRIAAALQSMGVLSTDVHVDTAVKHLKKHFKHSA